MHKKLQKRILSSCIKSNLPKKFQLKFSKKRKILHKARYCDCGHEIKLLTLDREDRWRCLKKCRKQNNSKPEFG